MALKDDFKAAAETVTKLRRRPDNDALLQLYGLYKQATEGDVTGSRPGILDLTGRKKYDAWAGLKGTAADKAMGDYVALVQRLKTTHG